jgi:hypothetical protein
MKLLVASRDTQGSRTNDFCWAEEGEIVTYGSECAEERVDGPCGCRRALRGVRTRKATTTFAVVERSDLSHLDLARLVAVSLVAGGWYPDVARAREASKVDALRLSAVALAHAEGTVLERRGDRFFARARLTAGEGGHPEGGVAVGDPHRVALHAVPVAKECHLGAGALPCPPLTACGPGRAG